MVEKIVHPRVGRLEQEQPEYSQLRDEALMWRAVSLAVESMETHGIDMPVGAVVAQGNQIVGRSFASDTRFGGQYLWAHAEVMADLDSQVGSFSYHASPDVVAVSLEPCNHCQDYFSRHPSVRRVLFGISRPEVAERGLVNPHDETIYERVERLGYKFEVAQISGPALKAGQAILDFTRRDLRSGVVTVDVEGFQPVWERIYKEATEKNND
jgi:pyrimidine deaminase RibD-like protein